MSKNKSQLITVLLIILAAGAFSLWRGFNPFSNPNQWHWQFEKTIIPKGQDTNQNPDVIQLKDGCFRLYSHGGEGTGLQNIYSYRSCDGLNWEFEGKRINKAAMPAAMIMADGKTRIYFQRGARDDKKQALVTAVSNNGLNFTNEQELLVTDEGELKGIKAIGHFELVKLDNGYRLYFDETGITPKDFEKYKDENWEWPVTRIRSLYSDDGLNWKLDPGIRIDYEQAPLSLMQRAGSSTVIKEADQYHMYFNAGFSPWEDLKRWRRLNWSGIYEAVSADGLNWNIIDRSLFGHGSDPKIIKMGEQLKLFISEGERTESNSIESYLRVD
jgi:hypothetical protein